jgi:hypothetical protein
LILQRLFNQTMATRYWAVLAFCAFLAACRDNEPTIPELAAELRLAVSADTLLVGDTLRMTATVLDARGAALPATVNAWRSSDSSIASVNTAGLVTAKRPGRVNIEASFAGVSASALILVMVNPLEATASCQVRGTAHTGTIETASWRADDSPHFLQDTVSVSNLVIEPGALICGGPGSLLLVTTSLTAEGVSNKTIVFTAADPAKKWGGIKISGSNFGPETSASGRIVHALIELGDIQLGWRTTLHLLDSHLRQASVAEAWCTNANDKRCGSYRTMYVRRTVVDTGNVAISYGGAFEDVTIRAGGLLVSDGYALNNAPTIINGGRIEDSPDVGMQVGRQTLIDSKFGIPRLDVQKAPRILRTKGCCVVRMPLHIFLQLWPTRAAQDSLLGNGANMVDLVALNVVTDSLHFRRDLSWSLGPRGDLGGVGWGLQNVTVEPGASLALRGLVHIDKAMSALGTSSAPITITGGINLSGSATSRWSHVRLLQGGVRAGEQHTLHVDHVESSSSLITLASPGSTISDAEMVGSRAALRLEGNGTAAERVTVRRTSEPFAAGVIIAASNVKLIDCEITDNQRDGIRVLSGAGVEIHGCRIERNGGLGVNNLGTAMVDARRNWWGDPAGPNGPAGDGVSANVDFSDFLAQAPAPRRRASSITVTPAQPAVATADTLRLTAVVKDSAGAVIVSEPLEWRIADPRLALPDPRRFGVIVGAHAGTTTVTVLSRNDTTVRATAQLTVTPGGPFYRWTREELPMAGRVSALWAAGAADAYAILQPAGAVNERLLLHYDGVRWSIVPGVALVGPYASITGLSSANVYAVGRDSLLHFDGTSWRTVAVAKEFTVAIFAVPGDVIFANTGRGQWWLYQNGSWRSLPNSLIRDGPQGGLWARSSTDAYLANSGRIFHWNGEAVSTVPTPPNLHPFIPPLSGTARFLYTLDVNSNTFRFDGSRWEKLSERMGGTSQGIHAASDSLIAVIGHIGTSTSLAVYDGARFWPVWLSEPSTTYEQVWIVGNDIFLVGGGHVLHGRRE